MDYLFVAMRISYRRDLLVAAYACVTSNHKPVLRFAEDIITSFRVTSTFDDTFFVMETLGNSLNIQYPYSWPSGSGS